MALNTQKEITIKGLYWQLLNSESIEKWRLNFMNLRRQHPIIIYTMGKVGSSSVYQTLRQSSIANPVYHVHFLSSENIKRVDEHVRTLPKENVHRHLLASHVLRKNLNEKRKFPWYVITLVRDPIARHISEFFETMWMYHPELVAADGAVDENCALDIVRTQLINYDERTDNATTWFHKEFQKVLDINVYQYPFNRKAGYGTISTDNFNILMLTLEKLDSNWDILADFVDFSGVLKPLVSNIGEEKSTSSLYQYVKKNLRLPRDVCERIYNSPWVVYAFTTESRDAFIRCWTE